MVPASPSSAELDLELCLGLPIVVAPGSNGLAPSNGLMRQAAKNGENYVGQGADDVANSSDDAEQPASTVDAPALLQLFEFVSPVVSDCPDPITPAPDQQAGEEEEAAAEPRCKRAKSEPLQTVNSVPKAVLVQEKTDNLHLPDEQRAADAVAVTEPAWVRAEFLPRQGLRADLPLHFVECKVLTNSDVRPDQHRLLVTSRESTRLRALHSADELQNCGLTTRSYDRQRRKKPAAHGNKKNERANTKPYPGLPVLVHERDVRRGASTLKLNTFHSTAAMVINGIGYKDIIASSGFVKGDCIEVWAFRRPRDQHLCLIIAKRDENRRPAINRQVLIG